MGAAAAGKADLLSLSASGNYIFGAAAAGGSGLSDLFSFSKAKIVSWEQ